MKSVEIKGNVRTDVGSKYAKAERKAGNVPCVVYGGEAPIHFSAPVLAFKGLVYTAEAKTAKITIGDTSVEAVIQDMQFHPVTDQLMHIDFIQLVEGKPVTMNIPVVLNGQARGVLNGGKLKTILRQLSVRAIPGQFPDSIELDITELRIGKSIRVSDVTPSGYEILNADTAVIVTVKKARGAMDDEDEDEEGAAEEGAEATAEAAAEE
ncbi:MAG: 50S ribosomal protein L25/general stress protein Ctc [Schleiferiaceae bacterium]|jgi:large subunit ribosomal protein L25|nr:50S ribosomal protein L25/general stress protein Ctc [Schleiferiaceae bacterium]MDA8820290.1 50S ribosomal protein L25/general stress protein Ctc [Schleiferiaceae bacterium]PSR06669.1 MAG: 50S ribosomal protein L25 [Bacteroidota bacterium]